MEAHLYVDLNRDRLAIFGSWLAYPPIDSLHSLFVQAESESPKERKDLGSLGPTSPECHKTALIDAELSSAIQQVK